MRLAFCIAALTVLTGCAHTQPESHGIPNFGVVATHLNGFAGIYCGGEPTVEGNAWLKAHGVTRQIKLNSEPDPQGTAQDFEVVCVPISTAEQFFGGGLDCDIPRAAMAIQPGTFVHCEHGKNRTQTVIGYWLLTLGVPRQRALAEMRRYGWGDSLPGLKWYWSAINRKEHP